jgi:hypothetical protein
MSFAIIRTEKLKSKAQIVSRLKHDLRMNQVLNSNPQFTHLNRNSRTLEGALRTYEKALEVASSKRKIRRDAVHAIDYLMTASPEFFRTASKEEIEAFFDMCCKFLIRKHGMENILNISVQYDETSPHVQALVVPIDDTGKLNCKSFLGGRQKMRALQDDFSKAVEIFGLERGKSMSVAKHQDIRSFYADLNKVANDFKKFQNLELKDVATGNIFKPINKEAVKHNQKVMKILKPVFAKAKEASRYRRQRDEERNRNKLLKDEMDELKQRNRFETIVAELTADAAKSRGEVERVEHCLQRLRNILYKDLGQKEEIIRFIGLAERQKQGFERRDEPKPADQRVEQIRDYSADDGRRFKTPRPNF